MFQNKYFKSKKVILVPHINIPIKDSKLINNRNELIKPMAKTLAEVYKNISRCKICGSLRSNNVCNNCNEDNKRSKKICVVENIADQWSIESSSIFDGYFHILGGTIASSGQ